MEGYLTVYDRLYDSVKSVIEDNYPYAGRGALSYFLRILSIPCASISVARYLGYRYNLLRIRRLPVPVISVGNLTLGGSGKTPVVSLLAGLTRGAGLKTAIVSRGYGGRASGRVNVISDGKSILMKPELSGDEPYMLAAKLRGVSVVTGKSRFMAGTHAVNSLGAEIVILDDGYQHMQLFRDINILVIDGKNYFGNGYIFPRGPLREPEFLKKRADLILFAKCDENRVIPEKYIAGKPFFRALVKAEELVFIDTGRVVPVKHIAGRRVYAFCGIGAPDSFFRLLSRLGAVVVGRSVFNDHYRYKPYDINSVIERGERTGAEFILTTEKDLVRIPFFKKSRLPVVCLKIDLDIVEGLDSFQKAVFSRLPVSL